MTNKITVIILAVVALGAAALLWVTLSGDPVPKRKPARARKSIIQDAAPEKMSVKKDVAKAKQGKATAQKEKRKKDKKAFRRVPEYVKLFDGDDEAVTMFTSVLSSAGSRIIDPDDSDSTEDVAKAKGNRAGIVDIVDEMIGKGGKRRHPSRS